MSKILITQFSFYPIFLRFKIVDYLRTDVLSVGSAVNST